MKTTASARPASFSHLNGIDLSLQALAAVNTRHDTIMRTKVAALGAYNSAN